MAQAARRRELGRGDRVLPGIWRLRLPLPWPGVPHVNAFAIDGVDGVVLVDTGIYDAGALGELERALEGAGRRLEDIELLVCTHAHTDHYGLAGPIVERAGSEGLRLTPTRAGRRFRPESSSRASIVSRASTRACACPATGGRSETCRRASKPTAPRCGRGSRAPSKRSRPDL